MLSKGVGMYSRIFLGLLVGLLCLLHLISEDFREESEVLHYMHSSRHNDCCASSIFSAGKNSHVRGDFVCFECRNGSLAARAVDLQEPMWPISRTGVTPVEKFEVHIPAPIASIFKLPALFSKASVSRYGAKQGIPTFENRFFAHFEEYLEGTRSHFVVAKISEVANSLRVHFLPHRKEYIVSVFKANKQVRQEAMEWISTSEAYRQAKAKEEWVLAADSVSLIGIGGSANDMYRQLLYVIEQTGLPIDKDAARNLINSRDKARTPERGLKMPSDHFATQKQASFIFPLEHLCHFSSNPQMTSNDQLIAANQIFSIIYSLIDPEAEAARGVKYQRFTVQPWFPRQDRAVCAGSLILTSVTDMQSLNDCYACGAP